MSHTEPIAASPQAPAHSRTRLLTRVPPLSRGSEKEDNEWDDEIEDFESSEDEIGDLLRGL